MKYLNKQLVVFLFANLSYVSSLLNMTNEF